MVFIFQNQPLGERLTPYNALEFLVRVLSVGGFEPRHQVVWMATGGNLADGLQGPWRIPLHSDTPRKGYDG